MLSKDWLPFGADSHVLTLSGSLYFFGLLAIMSQRHSGSLWRCSCGKELSHAYVSVPTASTYANELAIDLLRLANSHMSELGSEFCKAPLEPEVTAALAKS